MNYDSIIVELLGRVKSLEEKVGNLETQLFAVVDEEDEQSNDFRVTRSVARQFVMEKIVGKYPILEVQKGNRASGADIIITLKNTDTTLKAKFYYSKSHLEFPSSWHTVKKTDRRDDIDLHIFTVSYEDSYHTFLFSREELNQFISQKQRGSAGQFYFYFQLIDGKVVEVRDGERDVNFYYEHWDLIGEMLNTKKSQ